MISLFLFSIAYLFPFRGIRGFFQGNKTTITAIREDIKVLLMTVKGERLMHKEMGTNLPILAGQLFLQPTRTAEFIVLDFTIQPTGATFPE